jgi:hypothetical protein
VEVKPSTPAGLTAAWTDDGSVSLEWDDTSNNETGFEILRSDDGGKNYNPIGSVGTDVSTYVDSPPTTSYGAPWYEVESIGYTDYGNQQNDMNICAATMDAGATTEPSSPPCTPASPGGGGLESHLTVQVGWLQAPDLNTLLGSYTNGIWGQAGWNAFGSMLITQQAAESEVTIQSAPPTFLNQHGTCNTVAGPNGTALSAGTIVLSLRSNVPGKYLISLEVQAEVSGTGPRGASQATIYDGPNGATTKLQFANDSKSAIDHPDHADKQLSFTVDVNRNWQDIVIYQPTLSLTSDKPGEPQSTGTADGTVWFLNGVRE